MRGQYNLTVSRHGLDSIDRQVQNHLLHLFRIAFERRHRRRHVLAKGNPFLMGGVPGKTDDGVD